jgi:hypothetical protein
MFVQDPPGKSSGRQVVVNYGIGNQEGGRSIQQGNLTFVWVKDVEDGSDYSVLGDSVTIPEGDRKFVYVPAFLRVSTDDPSKKGLYVQKGAMEYVCDPRPIVASL